jgi:tRNA(Arg) A34 adenosine deaminase TadA
MNRRDTLICLCGIGFGALTKGVLAKTNLSSIPQKNHEAAMREAIAMALQNQMYPFGAVIAEASTGGILAKGVNNAMVNPSLHGEIACLNHYVAQYGNKNWGSCVLYTTGEPCPMCMSALIWAGIGGVVYGSSVATIKKSGIDAFTLSAKAVNTASPFSQTSLMGGILEKECDALFTNRKRS